MNFCVEATVATAGGDEALEPGDILLYNYPLRSRLPPPGRGGGDADLPRRVRCRLHDHQGPLARHRRQGALLAPTPSTSSRRGRSSRGSSSTAAVSATRHVPDGDRQLAASRRWSPVTSTPRSSAPRRAPRPAAAAREATGWTSSPTSVERMFDHGEASRALLLRADPRRPLRRPRAPWTTNGVERGDGPLRGRRRGRRLRRPGRLLDRARPAVGADQHAPAATVSGAPLAITMSSRAAAREFAQRGPLPSDRGVARAGVDVPPARPGALLPLRLAGAQAMRGDLPTPLQGAADRGAGLQRRRHLRARLVGRASETGALGRWCRTRRRPGRLAPRRRWRAA